ncbi:hypothetical protein LguiB_012989 [Lonicera macranthoides]
MLFSCRDQVGSALLSLRSSPFEEDSYSVWISQGTWYGTFCASPIFSTAKSSGTKALRTFYVSMFEIYAEQGKAERIFDLSPVVAESLISLGIAKHATATTNQTKRHRHKYGRSLRRGQTLPKPLLSVGGDQSPEVPNLYICQVMFPSTLLGTGGNWTLMKTISVTEYLNYEAG